MEFRGICVFLFIVLSVYCVQNAVGRPRDASVLKNDDVTKINSNAVEITSKQTLTEEPHTESMIPGRLWCQFEEVTEDPKCQEHCLPKGYSYGLCVNNTCSCI